MSGFNALAVRLARSRRRLERERATADTAHCSAGEDEAHEVTGIAAAVAVTGLKRGTNVIQFPRR